MPKGTRRYTATVIYVAPTGVADGTDISLAFDMYQRQGGTNVPFRTLESGKQWPFHWNAFEVYRCDKAAFLPAIRSNIVTK